MTELNESYPESPISPVSPVSLMYTLSQFTDMTFSGTKYELSPETLAILKTLNGLLHDQPVTDSATNYRSYTSQNTGHYTDDFAYKKEGGKYDRRGGNKGKHHNNNNNNNNNNRPNANANANANSGASDWAVLRNFKTTQVDEKQGIEKTLSLIRMTLNKLSNKNYDQPRDAILLLIQEIIDATNDSNNDEEDEDEDTTSSDDEPTRIKSTNNNKNKNTSSTGNLRYITQAIFDIASTNKFYSDIYATLYKELVDTHGIFRELLTEFINKYINTFRQIQYVDADTDYDQFCEYTKACDQQKATVAFITNLLKMGVLTAEETFQLIHEFYMYSLESMKMVDRENETEEVVECMSILITQSKAVLKGHGEWADTVVPMCSALASMKGGDYKSLTSRAIFKFKDVMDNISK